MQILNLHLSLVTAAILVPALSPAISHAVLAERAPQGGVRVLLEAKERGVVALAKPSTQEEQIRTAVELRDGSRIVGVPVRPIVFKSVYPPIKLDPAVFQRVDVVDEVGTATVYFLNGDRLSGTIATDPLRMSTVVGHVTIPLKLVSEIYPYGALRNGLIAYWQFEDNVQDSVGDHLLVGAQPPYLPGILGQALSQRGNVAALNLDYTADIDLNHDFTISFWAYRESSIYDNDAVFDNGSVYIAKRDADGWNSRMGVIITSTTDQRRVDLVDNSPMGQPPLNTWFHVVLYRRGDQMGLKVNNAGTAVVDVSGMNLANKEKIYLGMQQYGYPWQGRLDEFGIWKRGLTAQEIQLLYNDGKARRP